MTRTARRLAAGLLVTAFAVALGCAPAGTPAAAAPDPGKLKAAEARVAKLEDDLKGAAAARAELQARLSAAEARAATLERERNDARLSLRAVTADRDAVQARFETLRRSLQDLLGKADAVAGR